MTFKVGKSYMVLSGEITIQYTGGSEAELKTDAQFTCTEASQTGKKFRTVGKDHEFTIIQVSATVREIKITKK